MSKTGFLLIELMMAVAMLTIIASTVAYYQWNTLQLYFDARLRLEAFNNARSTLELIAVEKNTSHVVQKSDDVFISCQKMDEYSLPILSGFSHKFCENFAFIQVEAKWKSVNNQEQSVILISGSMLNNNEIEA